MSFYAVKVGREVGIFEDLKRFVYSMTGYPCACGKKFDTREKAEKFLCKNKTEQKVKSNKDLYVSKVSDIVNFIKNEEDLKKRICKHFENLLITISKECEKLEVPVEVKLTNNTFDSYIGSYNVYFRLDEVQKKIKDQNESEETISDEKLISIISELMYKKFN